MKSVFLVFSIASLFTVPSGAAEDPLAALDFLVGQWKGATSGTTGTDVFERELDGHVLQRRSHSITTPSDGKSQSSTEAQLTIYPTGTGDALAAIYFDNEGHVIEYGRVSVTPGQRVEFLSDGRGRAPGFRLTYSVKESRVLHVKFEMAPPGQSTYRVIAEADEDSTH